MKGMRASLYGFRSVAAKELLHLIRDPATLVIALMIPVIQLTLFGYAIDFDIRHISTAVVDLDRSRESREYIASLHNTQYLDIKEMPTSPKEAEMALRAGRCRVALIIPPDFARKSGTSQPPTVRALIDGSDVQVALRARMAFVRPGTGASTVEPRINMLYNPEMRSAVFMIPGLIGVILQLVTIALTSFSLVREREQGTLEQLMVSPVGRLGLMLGKLTPYAFLAMLEMCAVLVIGRLVFDVQVAGSITLLLALAIPFILATLALGLLISTIAQNQAQALQLTLLITLPSILMSGFVFPRETMPGPLYLMTFALPVTWFLEILRGIIVRGAGIRELWQSLAALVLITTILLSLATVRFHKSAS